MIELPLGCGAIVLLDDADEGLTEYRWRLDRYGYPHHATHGYLHRLVMGAVQGEIVDHINRDKLDNRRQNLRIVTHLQNSVNAGIRKDNKTGFKGVFWDKSVGRYVAQIRENGKIKRLGTFADAQQAADAYDAAALRLFGEYAFLNAKHRAQPAPPPAA